MTAPDSWGRRRSRAWEFVALAAILAAAGALRMGDLDRFIASDEVRWTCRSVNFARAVAEGRPGDTFQVGHPGVLTMILGGAALPRDLGPWPSLCRTTAGGSDLSALDDVGREGLLQTLPPLLFAARRGVALGTLGLLALLYGALRGAGVGAPGALVALALVAFDPFLLAHSRVLHLDAVLSLATVVAVVALAGAVAGGGRRLLVAAGAAAGLAMIQKSAAGLLAPLALLAVAAPRPRRVRPAAVALAVWSLGAVAAAVAAWPALWASPIGTMQRVLAKAVTEGAAPHSGGNFFLGRPVADPGPLFYPVAAALRLTPAGTLAVAAAAVGVLTWLAGRRRRGDSPGTQALGPPGPAVVALVAWGLLFTAALTLGPKKFDRYLLPALVAAQAAGGIVLGGAVAAAASAGVGARGRRPWAAALVVAVVAAQLASGVRSLPYPLAYYNPLLGGAKSARRAILVGWGEGYDLAADWLNALPEADQLEVSTPGVANFGPLFEGRTRSTAGRRLGRTDYDVLYISKVQRRRDEDLLAATLDDPDVRPAWVGAIAGIAYVWVYPNPTVEPVLAALADLTQEGDVVVADGEAAVARRYDGPRVLVRAWGHWDVADMASAMARDFPPGWRRAWVVRYPAHDPDVPLRALDAVADRGETRLLAGGAVELTLFTRRAP